MPKTLAVCLYLVLWTIFLGASEQHAAITKIDLDEVGPFIIQTNEQLGLKLPVKVLSDYAASIAVGNEFSDPVDVYYRGIVLAISYKIRKEEPGSIYIYFFSSNRELIRDIRKQMKIFSEDHSLGHLTNRWSSRDMNKVQRIGLDGPAAQLNR